MEHPFRLLRCASRYLLSARSFVLVSAALSLSVGVQDARAGALSTVSPSGASSSVTIAITGTGFNATASSNEVTFTPASGSSVTATATAVTTLSAATGLRRVSVVVPGGLPNGATALTVRNTATGELSSGKSFDVIAISLPDVTSAAVGASNVNVQIAGSPATAFVAGSTRATFGADITVNSTTVQSAHSLVANISVSATAAVGTRGVGVITNTQTATLAGAFSLVQAATNHPPVWSPVANPSLLAGSALDLQLVATDPDGDPLTLTATLPAFATFVDLGNGKGTLSLHPAQPGTYGVTVTATDSKGAVTSLVLSVTVTAANQPPTANAQQVTLAEDTTVQLTLTGVDPEGAAVSFSISTFPAHGSLSGTGATRVYTPGPDYYGPDSFQFVANDGVSSSLPATVAITVTEVNDPPVLGPDTAKLKVAGVLPGVPPLPVCGKPCGIIYGDPHLLSYDQAFYDAQAVGEVIATKSTTDDFEVQGRFAAPPNQRVVSVDVAVAMRVAGHRVAFYRTGTPTGFNTRIDGEFVTLSAAPQPLPGGGTVGTYGTDGSAAVTWPDGSVVIVSAVGVFPQYYRFIVEIDPVPSRLGHLIGMLGDANGNKLDDLVTRQGQPITFPDPPFAIFYGTYVNSWRVSMAESLFDYDNGKTTADFTDLTFPDAPATPQSLSQTARTRATNVCSQFSLTDPAFNDACLVDVGFLGDADFATEGAAAQSVGLGLPNNAGSMTVGTRTTVAVGAPGTTAVRTFPGTAGQQLTLAVDSNTIQAADVTVRDPSGNVVATQPVSSANAFHDPFTLPSTGTYTITTTPHDQDTGSLSFNLADVASSPTTTPGTPSTVSIDTAGQTDVRNFIGVVGQKYTLTVVSDDIGAADVTVRDPTGGVVTTQLVTQPTAYFDTFTLPLTGTYTITVEPHDQFTGKLIYTLNLVPDDTGTTDLSLPTTVNLLTIGEVGTRTFQGTAGEKVALIVVSNTIQGADPNNQGADLTILKPSGGAVATLYVSSSTAFLDTFTLPDTGTYTVKIDPRGQNVGSIQFVVFQVPDDTGTIGFTLPTTVTISTPGEVAVRSITATAGQQATLSVLDNDIAGVDLTVLAPDGTTKLTSLSTNDQMAFGSSFTFPTTDTYTITIDPQGQLTGTLTFALLPIANNVGLTTIGTPTPVTITSVGPAVYGFEGTAGQSVTLSVTQNMIPGVTLTVLDETATPVAPPLVATGDSATSSPFTLNTTGTYVITIIPPGTATGTLTFTLIPN